MSAKKKTPQDELFDLVLDEATQVSPPSIAHSSNSPAAQSHRQLPQSQFASNDSDDKTVPVTPASKPPSIDLDRTMMTESQPQTYHPPSYESQRSSQAPVAEFALRQSENIRIAQNKMTAMEEEIQSLRRDNEQLAAAGETFKRLRDELAARVESLSRDKVNEKTIFFEESKILKERLTAKEREVNELQRQVEELELRLDTNIRKIRKREKDLEHRLEISKIESAALMRSKDEMIMNLKRKIDQLEIEAENYNRKGLQIYKKLESKEDGIRRVVKALRIALSQLESEDEDQEPLKKAE